MGSPQLDEHTHYYYELIFCELAQLVVDSLLHALQDLRYLWSLHWRSGSLWAGIVVSTLNYYDI